MSTRLLYLSIAIACFACSGCDLGSARRQAEAQLAKAQEAEKQALIAKELVDQQVRNQEAEQIAAALSQAGARVETGANKSIVGVDFKGIEVTDELANKLSNLVKLEKLTIDKSALTLAGWKQLAKLANLQQLDLRDCTIDNEQLIAVVSGMPKLKALRLSGKSGQTSVDDRGMVVLAKCPELKVLAIDDLWVTTAGLQPLSQSTKLLELYAGGTTVDDEVAKILVQLPQLKKLRLSRTGIGIAALEALATLPLEDLDISEASGINDDSMVAIGKMKTLKRLNLWRDTVSEVGAAQLAGLTSLEWLNLDNTHINDDALPYLGGLRKLTFLHLGSTAVTDDGMVHLLPLKALKDLKVTRTSVTEQGVQPIKEAIPDVEIQLKYIEGE